MKKTLAEKYPDLAAQWNYQMNGSLTPDQVYPNDSKEIWWLYPYTDPSTGIHYDFQWKRSVKSRIRRRANCPFLTGWEVWPGFNDLATKFPELADQWDYENNGSVTPQNVTPYSHYNAFWVLPYDDPDTKKHFVFRWNATISSRTVRKNNCPYLSGRKVWPGFNDLATKYPELAAQWDYDNNGSLTPQSVTAFSRHRVSWIYPYDDPVTGKHFVFRWSTTVCNRTKGKHDCPYLSGQAVWPGFNDLATKYPELAAQWDYDNNGSLTPQSVTAFSNLLVSWVYPYDDPDTGKHFDFRWNAIINNRTNGSEGCPYLSGKKVWPGFNDLATKYPELAAQWDYDNNGSLTPQSVTAFSNLMVSWFYPYDDPDTGKHFVFRWNATISSRTVCKNNCPYLSGHKVLPGFNDLATIYPELIAQWDYDRNGSLTPQSVTAFSGRKVSWIYPYDDPITGKHFDFHWEDSIANRTKHKTGCPYLSGHKVLPGFNDLATIYPELIAQWDYDRNGSFTPYSVTAFSNRPVSWIYPYDDPDTRKHFDFRWETVISDRTSYKTNCPYLSGQAVWPGFNDLATKYPELAAQWDYKKNAPLKPEMVFYNSRSYAAWILNHYNSENNQHFVFKWTKRIFRKALEKSYCPYLKNMEVWTGYNDLETCYPDIAKEWHPTLNIISPSAVLKSAKQKYAWLCPVCGSTYFTSVYSRTKKGTGCTARIHKKSIVQVSGLDYHSLN